ncbi:MAG: Xaa-Pro peptidase family protein [Candidatus Paceibacterota bacterium]
MAHPERFKCVQKTLRMNNIDAVIVSNAANNYYLTGIIDNGNKNAFYTIILKNGFRFVTSNFHLKQAQDKLPKRKIAVIDKKSGFGHTIANILKSSSKIGFESENLTYAQFEIFKKLLKGKKLIALRDTVELARQIKDNNEIKLIKKAAQITDKTFSELLKIIKPGLSELLIKQKAIEIMNSLGATGTAFDPTIASGKNAADPHYEGANKKIKKGEMIVIDIGAQYKNYNADMTRMVFIGKATAKYKKMYQIVTEAQEAALIDCHTNNSPKNVFDNCVENFKRYGEQEYFTHSLGHGVGIDIHELPNLSPAGQSDFQNGMVFTVEPGLYHIGWGGIRIEDLCVMANGECVALSKASKNLIEII